ncbi:MAG: CPBP family intramembrane metalloprotease [Planctomycetota bacterium]|nr:MAG: CPBP family intramembrane metalloprotease [Planctomycetota bacterium]
MSWKNIRLVFLREVRDQLRDRRTLFMITILPVLLYPMLGLGIVEMMLTFSEQPRVVVILNADDLPTSPALLDQSGIGKEWFENGTEETSKLRVLSERTQKAGDEEKSVRRPRRGEKTDEELLTVAHQLAEKIERLHGLRPADDAPTNSNAAAQSTGDTSSESQTNSTVPSANETAEAASTEAKLSAAQDEISQQFGTSGFQVLVIIPKGYRAAMEAMQREIQTSSSATTDASVKTVATRVPPVLVVRNSADDKSMVAFGRVQKALQSWEDAVRKFSFEQAGLPKELQHPARLAWIEVAREEQVAASVWSKMFPALLVIMALTGAFYPAIDLGAGEKERGTMETLLISPAKRVELVLGKFATIMLFSTATALLNLLSMGLTGQQMSAVMSDGVANRVSLDFPGLAPLAWLVILLLPLSALFSALCLALATFARSTKEGQYYLTPLLMVVMGLTMFCLSPAVEMTPLYSVIPVVNVALLLKGLLLNSASSGNLVVYAIPVLISSIGYSMLALWWAIELYNSEDVLFREAEKLDIRMWFRQLLRTKDAVPALPEAGFCFILILMLQFVAMTYMKPDLTRGDPGLTMMRLIVIQQLTMIACPAVFMGVLLTTSLRATFRLRMPSITAMAIGVSLAVVAHPLSVELSQFLVEHQVFPELPESARQVMGLMKTGDKPTWLLLLVFAVTPAICEELAFRGFILSGLARGGRLAIAVGISSMMFGIIHMIPQQAFNAALLGLVLGLLAVYSRSLFPAMAFHFCNNAIATFHAGEGGRIVADGVFFSRDPDGFLRYEAPLLILCAIAGTLMIVYMTKIVIRDQDAKRRGLVPDFRELVDGEEVVA